MTIDRRGRRPRPARRSILDVPAAAARPRRSRPSGRTSSGSGATRSTRCARTSRAFRRRWPTRSSAATRGAATSSSIRSAAAGTTPLQACAEGRIGVGNDLNPLAHLLTAAKVEPATPAEAATRLAALRLGWAALGGRVARARPAGPRDARRSADASSSRRRAAGRRTRRDRDRSRRRSPSPSIRGRSASCCTSGPSLRLDDRTDRFLAAALTGILHGKSASYLSELMPNTFSMAPRYVRDFAARTGFASPERDVFGGLEQKLARLHREPLPRTPGIALLGDARDAAGRARAALRERGLPDRARLVVTSPPYLRVVKYGYYNWLRTWLLGVDARAIDAALDDAHHREPYLVVPARGPGRPARRSSPTTRSSSS